MCFLSTVLYIWYGFLSDTSVVDSPLSFHRAQALSGSWWQWLSAHFMHNNFAHYLFNMLGLGLLYLLHSEYFSARSFLLVFASIALGTSAFLILFSPSLQWYVGMSGVLHGIFAWGVVIDVYYQRKTGYLLALGLLIKVIDERFFATSNFMADLIEVGVAVDAHLYGAILGLCIGIISAFRLHLAKTNKI